MSTDPLTTDLVDTNFDQTYTLQLRSSIATINIYRAFISPSIIFSHSYRSVDRLQNKRK